MRPLEILIPIILAAYLLWRNPRPSVIRLAPVLAILITVVHFVVEGYRWQMIPLYVLTMFLGIWALLKFNSMMGWKHIISILTFVVLAVSTAVPIVLPVPAIPAPSGPYQVGTTTYELTDTARKELYSGRDEARRFQIQVWYPAEPSPSNERVPWMSDAEVFAPAIARNIEMPSFFLDHLEVVSPCVSRCSSFLVG